MRWRKKKTIGRLEDDEKEVRSLPGELHRVYRAVSQDFSHILETPVSTEDLLLIIKTQIIFI